MLPAEVQKQLDEATSIDRATWPAMTLGPKFPPESNLIEVVGQLYQDVNLLIMRKLLNPDSPFAKDALSVLDNYLQAATQAGNLPVEDFVGPPLTLHEKPGGPLEAEVASAINHATLSGK